jgi:hypothetical protein
MRAGTRKGERVAVPLAGAAPDAIGFGFEPDTLREEVIIWEHLS